MNIPENLKYSQDHEWIRSEGEFAFVGITDFAQSELGDIVYVEIETISDLHKHINLTLYIRVTRNKAFLVEYFR